MAIDAARLMAKSDPGGALVSATVRQTIRGSLGERLVSRGVMQLDKMAETIEAFALAAACALPAAARNLPVYDAQTADPGVPKFLWAKDAAAAIAKSPQPRLATDDDESRARAHLTTS